MTDEPLLRVSALSKFYGSRVGCEDISFELWPGEVLAVVGEAGALDEAIRVCGPGELQRPSLSWRQDGLHPLRSLLRR